MDSSSFLESRLDAAAWPLAIGDFIILFAFLFLGILSHWPLDIVLASPEIILNAAGPFILGWIIAAPLIGAYSPGAISAPNSSVPLVVRSWVVAAILGFLIREFAIPSRGVTLDFALVMLVGGAVVLGIWRFVFFKLFS